MAASWGPLSQGNGVDARWSVNWSGAQIILHPSALTPNTVIRSHDFGMKQPHLNNPNPYPDYFTSVVVERADASTVQFYLLGK